jgi:hypothetical protein
LIKDDVKVKVPNETPKFLIISDGVDTVLKSNGTSEGDHALHL